MPSDDDVSLTEPLTERGTGSGAETVRQCVEAGLVDDIQIHVAPLLLGDGVRLSAGLAKAPVSLTTVRVCDSPSGVTHLHFRITR
jgi:riboflavin biosynthesis pyrimidine reductase